MSTPVDRFKNRRAVLEGKTIPNMPLAEPQPSLLIEAAAHSFVAVRFNDEAEFISTEADALLAEIHGRIDDEKISALIDACQKECLQVIIRPFGVARFWFNDKDGGNVTTTHNFRKGIVATNDDKKIYDEWQERKKLNWQERRKPYDDASVPIRKANKQPAAPNIVSGYTGEVLEKNKHAHYEHITSVREIETNSSRNLRMTLDERINLATSPKNTTYAEDAINTKVKGRKILSKDDKDLMIYYNSLREDERNELGLKRDLVVQEYRKSKRHIAIEDTKSWIRKDARELSSTGAREGGKMALQQAVGLLLEEFVRAAFAEVKDAWKNGFKGSVDDAFLGALKERLMRVAKRVQSRWKDAAFALPDGFISGFLSNLVTYIINTFLTTARQWVRVVREGSMSLYRALKILAFPPEDMSLAQAADAASKLLAAGLVISGGILLEAALEPSLKVLGPLAPYVSAICVGAASGLCTVFAVFLLDQIDLFGVNAQSRHEHVVAKLKGMISMSYERAVGAASVFDGPVLLHLT
jgi:hypothetical protein